MATDHAPYTPGDHGTPLRDVSVRIATVEDSLGIAQVDAFGGHDPAKTEPLIRAELSSIAQGNHLRQTWVALRGELLLGYGRCALRGTPEPPCALPPGWYLSGVRVLPSFRRQGIGHRLVQARVAWVLGRGVRCRYYTHPDNLSSVALHAAFGFREEIARVDAGGSDGPSRLFTLDPP